MKALYFCVSILFLISRPSLAANKNEDDITTKDALDDALMDQAASTEQMAVDLYSAINDCNDTFRIPMGYLQALNESGSFPEETDKTGKCYVRCLLEKTGIATTEGVYDPAKTAVVFEDIRKGKRDQIEAIAKTCVDRQESCKCERAYAYVKCLIQSEIEKTSTSKENI